jgi:predicted amidohydrolase YtcJ
MTTTAYTNANIHTLDPGLPRAEAIVCRDGLVAFLGPNSDALACAGPGARVVCLEGLTVVPGFIDSHCHLRGIGERERLLNLEGVSGIPELQSRLEAHVATVLPGAWVIGRGWIETFWDSPSFPTRQDLDSVSPANPVCLTRADGHAVSANSAALAAAGISKNSSDPPGGEILRDRASGEPTGVLIDRAAGLVRQHIPAEDNPDLADAIRTGLQRSAEMGWCQIHDAGGSWDEVDAIQSAHQNGAAPVSVYKALGGPGKEADRLLDEGMLSAGNEQALSVRAIKLFLDGALGSRGAAMLEPYADADTSGLIVQDPEDLKPLLDRALRTGIQVWTHAIGDRANRIALDLYEEAFRSVPPETRAVEDPRWRVEHAQILHPDDIPRFSRLGVIPVMQASHAIGDLHFAPSRLGMSRMGGAYPWRSLLDTGCIIPGGSDAPVEKGDPVLEFYAAVVRRSVQGADGPGWHPEQSVARADALKMLTQWPAYAAFQEDIRGSLSPGKRADLTVLSADLMTVPDDQLLQTRCLMTVIGGEVAFDGRT